MVRPTWVEVDLDAIRRNVEAVAAAVAPAELCAVVKADGYGHGDVPVAEAALSGGATWLAVAIVAEGVRLREAGIDAPILLLSEPTVEEVGAVVDSGLVPTVYTEAFVDAMAAAAAESPAVVHLKVDTGMHRVGADPDAAFGLAQRISADDRLRLGGVWTHLAVAEEDAEFTEVQLGRFAAFARRLEAAGIDPGVRHAANSAGALDYPHARYDMVRVGLAIYGMRPAPGVGGDVPLQPAMRVISHVSHLRRLPAGARPSYGRRRPLPGDAWVATVPIGYADGVERRLSSVGGEVLIGGERYPFAGTVTMDQIVIDVGDAEVAVGDEVVLLGSQRGAEIAAEEWAALLGTINYEIVCRFGPRIPRRHEGLR